MNLADATIVLRPRGVAELFDLACRFCAQNALALYLRLAAVTLLPGLVACLVLRYAQDASWFTVWLVAVAWVTVSQGVFTVAASRLLLDRDTRARDVLKGFRARLFSYLGALFLSRMLLLFGASVFLLLLPSAWTRMLFVHEASLLEGATSYEATTRSTRFIRGRGGIAFQVLMLILLAQAGSIAIAELLADGLLADVLQLGNPFGGTLDQGGSPFALAGLFVSVPYVATARFLHYIDTRTRTDGWDIQVRLLATAALEKDDAKRAAA